MNSEIIVFGIQSSSTQDLLTCCHTSNITVFGFAAPILAPCYMVITFYKEFDMGYQ